MKVYMVIEKNDGATGGCGEFVALHGIYTDIAKAYKRKQELDRTINADGYLIQNNKEFRDCSKYEFEIHSAEVDKDINKFLGGYA